MFKSRYVRKTKYDEDIDNLKDELKVQSSLADAEINSLKGRLQESDKKFDLLITSLGKVIDDNFAIVKKEEYDEKMKKLGGLITSNNNYHAKIDVIENQLKNLTSDNLKLTKELNDCKNINIALESTNKNILEEKAKLQKIIEDLSKPKDPPTMEKLIEYKDMSKNGKGKLTRRNKKIH